MGAQIKTFGPFLRLAFQDGTVKSPAKVTVIMGFSQVNLIKCDVGTVVKYQFQSIFFDDFLHILKSLFHIQLMKHFVLYQDFFKNLMLTEEIKDVPLQTDDAFVRNTRLLVQIRFPHRIEYSYLSLPPFAPYYTRNEFVFQRNYLWNGCIIFGTVMTGAGWNLLLKGRELPGSSFPEIIIQRKP